MIDEKTVALWRKHANGLLRKASYRHGSWVEPHGVVGPSMAGFRRAAIDLLDRWDGRTSEALADYYHWDGYVSVPFTMKAIRIGYALATERWDLVTPTESDWLRDKGYAVPQARRDPVYVGGDERGFMAEFVHTYRATKPGATRKLRHALATATVAVERVDPGRTVPVWGLPRPDGGPPLEVVSLDGDLFRPVLTPGSWEPATEAEFVRACAGVDAWADTPFANLSALAPREFAFETPDRRPSDAENRETERLKALARAGRLVSIGGIVHRRTEEPVIHLSRRGDYHLCLVTFGWKVSGLRYEHDQSPMRETRSSSPLGGLPPGAARRLLVLAGSPPESGGRVVDCAVPVPLGPVHAATRLALEAGMGALRAQRLSVPIERDTSVLGSEYLSRMIASVEALRAEVEVAPEPEIPDEAEDLVGMRF